MSVPYRSAPEIDAILELDGVGFDYPGTTVIDGLDLEVTKDEIVVCVGPSGCGKSTLLGLLGGHLKPTRGSIVRKGQSRTIYQDGGLFPWQTVRENMAVGLSSEITGEQRTKKVAEWLEITRLVEFADHYPHQLSGGMRQRVELARVLAGDSDILLMDEPFSALDYQARLRLRRELVRLLEKRPRTVVFVNHDI